MFHRDISNDHARIIAGTANGLASKLKTQLPTARLVIVWRMRVCAFVKKKSGPCTTSFPVCRAGKRSHSTRSRSVYFWRSANLPNGPLLEHCPTIHDAFCFISFSAPFLRLSSCDWDLVCGEHFRTFPCWSENSSICRCLIQPQRSLIGIGFSGRWVSRRCTRW